MLPLKEFILMCVCVCDCTVASRKTCMTYIVLVFMSSVFE